MLQVCGCLELCHRWYASALVVLHRDTASHTTRLRHMPSADGSTTGVDMPHSLREIATGNVCWCAAVYMYAHVHGHVCTCACTYFKYVLSCKLHIYMYVYVHVHVALYSLLLLSFFLYLKSVPIHVIVHVQCTLSVQDCCYS